VDVAAPEKVKVATPKKAEVETPEGERKVYAAVIGMLGVGMEGSKDVLRDEGRGDVVVEEGDEVEERLRGDWELCYCELYLKRKQDTGTNLAGSAILEAIADTAIPPIAIPIAKS
jgi:hypothetical protein